jgi:diguanylate cyclase (GGDEF)-like protein
MQTQTLVLLLAINMICSGGLYYLIVRQMPPGSGLGLWSAAAILFGGAYLIRMIEGLHRPTLASPVLDVVMVTAAAMFLAGLRRFLGRRSVNWNAVAIGAAAYAVVLGLVNLAWGAQGRYVLLNGALGAIWLAFGATAARSLWRGDDPAMRAPMAVAALLIGTLGVLTLLRGAVIAIEGTGSMYGTTPSAIYYIYASIAVILQTMNFLWMVFLRLQTRLAELASHDALTRLLNRNGLDEQLQRHFARRETQPVTLLQLDVDHFKRINDAHGHAVGDVVLQAVAGALTAHVRGGDFVARVGGEEFVIGCVGGGRAAAEALAERVRASIGALRIEMPNAAPQTVGCTVSIGVSREFASLDRWEMAWREADNALYSAKQGGRNRVAMYVPA